MYSSLTRAPPSSTLFPYTTLFRSDAMLGLVQNDLFDLGADLAVPPRDGKAERLRVLPSQVERLERDIDTLNAADRKSTRLNSSHGYISYAVFCLKKKKDESRRIHS